VDARLGADPIDMPEAVQVLQLKPAAPDREPVTVERTRRQARRPIAPESNWLSRISRCDAAAGTIELYGEHELSCKQPLRDLFGRLG